MKIVGIAGSPRQYSKTREAVEVALEAAAATGAEIELIDLRALGLPHYDPDSSENSGVVREFLEKVAEADALILGTPVYHGSMSALLKNALDHFEDLGGKVVAFISVAGGMPGTNAITSLQFVAQSLHAISLPANAAISDPRSASSLKRLEMLGRELVGLTARLQAYAALT
jgi:FMN reductase